MVHQSIHRLALGNLRWRASILSSWVGSPVWKVRRALGDFSYFSAPQHVLLRFVVRGNLIDGLVG
ncbi:hypothetical protein PGT21_012137 [Puccinia graminis f. sp. tritici]|uniref:Uncharacterized protein n=1 Tax=Puccinia graminis f. sp. tritici TaxID=56615 RepID=A0A5B0MQZ1_PUCGR|nr:hypothetical protein PGT21_012137 [Puccinia graminis f. sp. tritici]